ncbi:unnamed protein product, partial [Discosporangium mesarthrocarpum]
VRVAWVVVASVTWDATSGHIKSSTSPSLRVLFYVLDELPATMLFTLYSALALFWTELYFISLDEEAHETLQKLIRPAQFLSNVAVYLALGTGLVVQSTYWNDQGYYVSSVYAYLTAGMYLCAGGVVLLAAWFATQEFRMVPIQLQARQHRVAQV